MTGGPGESWQEREARRRRVAEEARALDREPAAWWARLALVVATAAWLATIAWMAATLPEQVPTHWSAGGTPDGWSSKAGALAFVVLLPHLLEWAAPYLPFVSTGSGGLVSVFQLQTILFGVLIIVFLTLEPRGLFGLWHRVRTYFKTWPFSY